MTGVLSYMKTKNTKYTDAQMRILKMMAGVADSETEKIPFEDMNGVVLDADEWWVKFRMPTGIEKDELQALRNNEVITREVIIDPDNPLASTTVESRHTDTRFFPTFIRAAELGIIVEAQFPDIDSNGNITTYKWEKGKLDNLVWLRERKFEMLIPIGLLFYNNVMNYELEEVVFEGEDSVESSAPTLVEEAL